MFETLADLLAIEGANRFRVRAYRTAAHVIANLPREAASMVVEGEDLTELPGIGDDLAGKIAEIVRTGHLALLDEITKRTPPGFRRSSHFLASARSAPSSSTRCLVYEA